MTFSDYSKIQSEYATYSPQSDVGREYKKASDNLTPLRPPTAPKEDIQKVRKEILNPRPGVLFLQIALFIVFLCLLTYTILPMDYAHGVAFLLLCVGVAIGIFLRN